ncbi:trypsin-like serine protease [uncultured Microbacterium sp.]|uniref:Putative trypsin-like serine protease n=1 Tax=uncultured Microbacterium sp. TaxID=191216 RepID=A0A1Y5P1K0_9MICO|nr:trypsin-like serine protease [uncultured Microbacterium sp.]SBS72545.1 putative trypsin-like serine protease [uncultured Microbacterium sp.]
MRRPAFAVAAVAALLLVSMASPAQAITDGVPDGDDHPQVGLMVAFDADGPAWRCSGTLISPTVYLTAGHCTYGATHVEIWFGDDIRDAAANSYPTTGDVSGTPYTHPQYDDAAFYLYDVGVVVLDEPVILPEYGTLPTLNLLDTLGAKSGKKNVTFTAVGYGLQKSFPDAASWKDQAERLRMVSYPKLNQINTGFTGDGSLLLSNNAHTGGTCSGDSGGPNFLGDSLVIAGVTSFGLNSTCAGTGGVYRVDRADDLAFIGSFLD